MGKLLVAGVVVALLLFYIITSPDNAANIANSAWDGIVDIAHGIGRFVDKLSS